MATLGSGPATSGSAMRMSAKHMLEDKANRAESHAHALRDLLEVIPWDGLSKEVEARLWCLICDWSPP